MSDFKYDQRHFRPFQLFGLQNKWRGAQQGLNMRSPNSAHLRPVHHQGLEARLTPVPARLTSPSNLTGRCWDFEEKFWQPKLPEILAT